MKLIKDVQLTAISNFEKAEGQVEKEDQQEMGEKAQQQGLRKHDLLEAIDMNNL